RFGMRYVRPFRRFLEDVLRLRQSPEPGGLQAALSEAAESLCRMLVEATGASEVLFNNAVFGREVEMLEIFGNCRAVVVFRDPADVYADRVAKDRNHWRNPGQLAELYCRSLARYLDYRERQGAGIRDRIREVPFERFVSDTAFREQVRDWLLQAVDERGCGRFFDPSVSARNIGIHQGMLDRSGRRQIRPARELYRQLAVLADAARSGPPPSARAGSGGQPPVRDAALVDSAGGNPGLEFVQGPDRIVERQAGQRGGVEAPPPFHQQAFDHVIGEAHPDQLRRDAGNDGVR